MKPPETESFEARLNAGSESETLLQQNLLDKTRLTTQTALMMALNDC